MYKKTVFFIGMSTLWADKFYLPYHTSHLRVNRDKNNTQYQVELPVEAYEQAQQSIPSLIIPPKPITYLQEDDPSTELDYDDEPELMNTQ